MCGDIIEKKDCYKKFYEQFGKFLEQLGRFSNLKSGDDLNRLTGAQCVQNGRYLSRNDCVGEALSWNACVK